MSPVPAEHFRLLFESGPGLHVVLTPAFTIVAVSDAYARATMTERSRILGRGIFEVFPDDPNDPSATGERNLRASLERVLALRNPDTMAVQKYPIRRPESDGGGFEERYWSPVNTPVISAAGELIYIIHRVEDVTDFVREQLELRLRSGQMESEIFLRAQELAEANLSLRRLYDQVAAMMSAAGLESHQHRGESSLAPDEVLAGITRLINDYRSIEEQFRQAQKMEAIGRLAGGVAHDFNNLLTVISGYAAIAAQQLGEGPIHDHVHEHIREIEGASNRAAALTTQLLAFSRKQPLCPVVMNLADVLENLDPMVRRLLGADIEVIMRRDADVANVKLDPSQLDQVVMNLVVNARDAMPRGGRLEVELQNHVVDSPAAAVDGLAAGRYTVLRVRDNGAGMTPAVKDRIFEPFFTTKDSGSGTGLGLAVVYGVVRQSGGHIEVESELGAGTAVTAYFPAVVEQAEMVQPGQPVSLVRGTETILVVDDSPSICELVRQTMEGAGYKVMIAVSADEALKVSDQCGGPIHLLLTDLILPRIGGSQIAQAIRSRRPGIKVLFMSGHPEDDERSIDAIRNGDGFMQKPFRIGTLRDRVREILDMPRPIRKVLVIDDEKSICDLLAAILKKAGYEVMTARDGLNARERVRANPVDLVITDLCMPQKDGIETIRELKKDDPSLRLIAMSGAFGDDVLRSAELLGANATFKKPLPADALIECIEQLSRGERRSTRPASA